MIPTGQEDVVAARTNAEGGFSIITSPGVLGEWRVVINATTASVREGSRLGD